MSLRLSTSSPCIFSFFSIFILLGTTFTTTAFLHSSTSTTTSKPCTITTTTITRPTSSSLFATEPIDEEAKLVSTRRTFLQNLPLQLGALSVMTLLPKASHATIMDISVKETKTFKVGEKLSTEEGKQRLVDAIKEVDELITNYSEISKGGGDSVRRYLGTVGVTSKMYGIMKVVRELRDDADDIVEYTEAANEFEAYLYQAEGAAYQSLFVEHSSAKGTPESFLATAKKDVVSMRKYMGDVAAQLKIN
mmetsp:Transcript_17031/g.19697  ORF Transcript_17031/g.19697 Transcript_17031/m.19697 type:complete len:249 (+) Transcript_17031:269-1015(+)